MAITQQVPSHSVGVCESLADRQDRLGRQGWTDGLSGLSPTRGVVGQVQAASGGSPADNARLRPRNRRPTDGGLGRRNPAQAGD